MCMRAKRRSGFLDKLKSRTQDARQVWAQAQDLYALLSSETRAVDFEVGPAFQEALDSAFSKLEAGNLAEVQPRLFHDDGAPAVWWP